MFVGQASPAVAPHEPEATGPVLLPFRRAGLSYCCQIKPAKIVFQRMGKPRIKSKREAVEAVKSAFEQVKAKAEAHEEFAKICHEVHEAKWLTDTEISNAVGGKPSRTRIQQLRKRVRENDDVE